MRRHHSPIESAHTCSAGNNVAPGKSARHPADGGSTSAANARERALELLVQPLRLPAFLLPLGGVENRYWRVGGQGGGEGAALGFWHGCARGTFSCSSRWFAGSRRGFVWNNRRLEPIAA
jgi:hypothetical protein